MKWSAKITLRAKVSETTMSLHGYLWKLRVAGALWEWGQR